MEYSGEQRAFYVTHVSTTRSATTDQRKYRTRFNKAPPKVDTIKKWHAKFLETGSTTTPRKPPQPTVLTTQTIETVEDHFGSHPHDSVRRASLFLDIKKTTLHRALKTSKFHPYKVQNVQMLKQNDKQLRLHFAQDQIERISSHPDYLSFVTFSDEAHFHLDGRLNKQNCRFWSKSNPNWTNEEALHSPRTTVWAALSKNCTYGPFFFDQNVTSDMYLQMLHEKFWPQVEEKGLQESIVFMQDGAPPHWGLNVRHFLDEQLPNRWIGRGSQSMPWPPRSPDLTPCDFFLWGFVKSKVYAERPQNIQELKLKI